MQRKQRGPQEVKGPWPSASWEQGPHSEIKLPLSQASPGTAAETRAARGAQEHCPSLLLGACRKPGGEAGEAGLDHGSLSKATVQLLQPTQFTRWD